MNYNLNQRPCHHNLHQKRMTFGGKKESDQGIWRKLSIPPELPSFNREK